MTLRGVAFLADDHENSLDEVLSATEDASDAAKRLVENRLPHAALKQHHVGACAS